MNDYLNDFSIQYNKDLSNWTNWYDYTSVENTKQQNETLNQISSLEAIAITSSGIFSTKINNKYLIINKELISPLYPRLFNEIIKYNKIAINTDIPTFIIPICNLLLMFASENHSIYNLKKKCLLCHKQNIKITSPLITSEYIFISHLNKTLRKSGISWDYRDFLIEHFKDRISWGEIIIDKNEKVNLWSVYSKWNVSSEVENLSFISTEITLLNKVNYEQNRNYHMWKYCLRLFNRSSQADKMILFLFSCYLFSKCFTDYSACSFIINTHAKSGWNAQQLNLWFNYFQECESLLLYDNNDNKVKYVSFLSMCIEKCRNKSE